MPEFITSIQAKEELRAVVIRCRCGDPASHVGRCCPQGEAVDLGLLAYKHRNPIKHALGQVRVAIQAWRTRKIR